MSTLDHAFIRAYTGDSIRPAPAAGGKSVQEEPASQAPARQWHVRPGAPRPGTVVPPPHISLAAFGNVAHSGPSFSFSTTTIESAPAFDLSPAKIDNRAQTGISAEKSWGHSQSADDRAGSPIGPENPPRAAYEVDHFAWPELCATLSARLAPQFDELAEQLLAESALGRKVIALSGACRGEGRTTLALLLAQRLAGTGAKVLLVDADFDSPQLATRLGLGVAGGWRQVLEKEQPAWEAMIESLDDRVALLPLVPQSATSEKIADKNSAANAAKFMEQHADAMRQHLGELREHFDVVLLDAGPDAADHPAAKSPAPRAAIAGADAAILVSDTRIAASSPLANLYRRLLDANIVPLGVAETFCKADAVENNK